VSEGGLLGELDRISDGATVVLRLGAMLGRTEGFPVGDALGLADASLVGSAVGLKVGSDVDGL